MLKYGLPGVAALLLLFGVFSVARTRPVYRAAQPPKAPPVSEYKDAVGGVGLVEATTENVSISTPVPGLVTHVFVKAGASVSAGQKLFSLDDRDLRAELEVRKSAVETARSQLEKLVQSPRPEEVPVLEAKVAEAEQTLADAKVQQQLIESVTDRRAVREEDLQRRRIAVASAEARLNEAKADLALLKAGAWQQDVNVARAEVAAAEKEVQRVQTDIDRLTVTAPFDGQVLQSNIHLGEYAEASSVAKPLMLFGDVSLLNVRVDVDEHEAWKIHPGAAAYATVRGNSGIQVPLRFVRIEPYVLPKKSLTGDSTERVDTRVLQVLYSFERSDKPIYVGQQMDIFIDGAIAETNSRAVEPGGVEQ